MISGFNCFHWGLRVTFLSCCLGEWKKGTGLSRRSLEFCPASTTTRKSWAMLPGLSSTLTVLSCSEWQTSICKVAPFKGLLTYHSIGNPFYLNKWGDTSWFKQRLPNLTHKWGAALLILWTFHWVTQTS